MKCKNYNFILQFNLVYIIIKNVSELIFVFMSKKYFRTRIIQFLYSLGEEAPMIKMNGGQKEKIINRWEVPFQDKWLGTSFGLLSPSLHSVSMNLHTLKHTKIFIIKIRGTIKRKRRKCSFCCISFPLCLCFSHCNSLCPSMDPLMNLDEA